MIKRKIDKSQQNSKCRLYSDRDEMINHIISESNRAKRVQDKTWLAEEDDQLEIVQETEIWPNELQNPSKTDKKILCDFEIQTDHLISSRRSGLVIFIIKSFQTIVFIFIVISTTFRLIYLPGFFRFLSNSETYTELRTASFIESTGVTCSDSVSHNWVQVLSIPVLLHAYSQDWTCNLQMIV